MRMMQLKGGMFGIFLSSMIAAGLLLPVTEGAILVTEKDAADAAGVSVSARARANIIPNASDPADGDGDGDAVAIDDASSLESSSFSSSVQRKTKSAKAVGNDNIFDHKTSKKNKEAPKQKNKEAPKTSKKKKEAPKTSKKKKEAPKKKKNSKNGPPPPPPPGQYYTKKSPKKNSKKNSPTPVDPPTEFPTDEPTEEPTDEPTEEPTDEPTEEPTDGEPTDAPSDAISNSFTFSPIASTSSGVDGIAAPEDILTIAEFDRTLKEETDSILGVSSAVGRALESSNCVVETSAIQYDASSSDSVCKELFTTNQLVGVSFCYRFQITISAPTSGGGCEVNMAAQLVMGTLEENGSANAIGPVNDMEIVQIATTNSPTSASPISSPPTSGGSTTEPTSGEMTIGPTTGGSTTEPTSGGTSGGPTTIPTVALTTFPTPENCTITCGMPNYIDVVLVFLEKVETDLDNTMNFLNGTFYEDAVKVNNDVDLANRTAADALYLAKLNLKRAKATAAAANEAVTATEDAETQAEKNVAKDKTELAADQATETADQATVAADTATEAVDTAAETAADATEVALDATAAAETTAEISADAIAAMQLELDPVSDAIEVTATGVATAGQIAASAATAVAVSATATEVAAESSETAAVAADTAEDAAITSKEASEKVAEGVEVTAPEAEAAAEDASAKADDAVKKAEDYVSDAYDLLNATNFAAELTQELVDIIEIVQNMTEITIEIVNDAQNVTETIKADDLDVCTLCRKGDLISDVVTAAEQEALHALFCSINPVPDPKCTMDNTPSPSSYPTLSPSVSLSPSSLPSISPSTSCAWTDQTIQCMGLTLSPGVTSWLECQSNCCNDSTCEVWQFNATGHEDECWFGTNCDETGDVVWTYGGLQDTPSTICTWTDQITQCDGLAFYADIKTSTDCQNACCNECTCDVWQFSATGYEDQCWFGTNDCDDKGDLTWAYGGLKDTGPDCASS